MGRMQNECMSSRCGTKHRNYGASGTYEIPYYGQCPKCYNKIKVPFPIKAGWEFIEKKPYNSISDVSHLDSNYRYIYADELYVFKKCSICHGTGEIIIGYSTVY